MDKKQSKLNCQVGKNLRKHRLLKNYSQEKLAEISGLHRTYIGSIERCERNITLETLEMLAKALSLSPVKLLDSADNV